MSSIYENKKVLQLLRKHEKRIINMLKNVDPETLKDEVQIKKMLRLLVMFSNIPITESQINQLAKDIKTSGLNPKDPQAIEKFLNKHSKS
ncbi:stage VI sporulation protein F [Desulfuribacillus alkaliarsenatis]|uniref:Uncharacterized protein n=1 Tax=Desulfuribacillus alkaliarsenatis TaxID=766136 RepID=A0A1E5G4W4_9FIRM|nr:stage VI sporulation protein F [Desulfuribacillus alkaliarsenatis]OEF98203.1 hypothetical protein BHF68_00505 [Desulfuribacillus alkaliarsenatis]